MVLQAIKYERGSLKILDQLQLPHHEIFIEVKDPEAGWLAIKSMQVRGAPAIAIVAALSLAVHLSNSSELSSTSPQRVASIISLSLKFLTTSRPTAVNLLDAARKLESISLAAASHEGSKGADVVSAYVQAAERMLRDDVDDNENIGNHGAEWIKRNCQGPTASAGLSVMTHCNTGSLATAGFGTALGVIRSLHSQGLVRQAFYTETRPYNQGARLTGFELIRDQIPAQLVTDSMVGLLLASRKASDNIVCVVVGADRVAANGDTANKIGTYSLAVLARYHDIKFLVAAPRTSIDLQTPTGADIVIEERPPREMTCIKGPEVHHQSDGSVTLGDVKEITIAPIATQAWNPSFDVTPANLIDGIITEKGVLEKDSEGRFQTSSIFQSNSSAKNPESGTKSFDEGGNGPPWNEVVRMKVTESSSWKEWMKGTT